MAYHSHLQFTRAGFLDQVKLAAGKLGTYSSRDAARISITEWLNSNPAGMRNVFAHAAMLRCLVARFTFEWVTVHGLRWWVARS